MTPAQKDVLRKRYQEFKQLPAAKQRALALSYWRLQGLSTQERQAVLTGKPARAPAAPRRLSPAPPRLAPAPLVKPAPAVAPTAAPAVETPKQKAHEKREKRDRDDRLDRQRRRERRERLERMRR